MFIVLIVSSLVYIKYKHVFKTMYFHMKISYLSVLYIPEVSVKNGKSFLRKVQYQVENVLASIISATPLMKNIVQKKPSKLTTESKLGYN